MNYEKRGGGSRSLPARVGRRLWVTAATALVLTAAVYTLSVRTVTGQRWENAVLAGRRQDETLAAARDANHMLDHVTVSSLGAAVAMLMLIGLARRRPALTAVAVGTVGIPLLLAEVLKRYVLSRPELVDAPARLSGNSFPSGHTTIAMSVLFGLALVVPYRLRGIAVGVCALWAISVGAYTVAAGWHRPSDTIGADLLVLAVACALAGLLARTGRVRPATERPSPLSALFLAPLCLVTLGGLGGGSLLLLESVVRLSPADPAVPRLAYAGGHALAAGASAAVTVVLLASLHRIDLDDPAASP
ncbi:phosphatase PAP2 family protein [Streptomyces sp. NPDC004658]|uniref:phosphatase PAP2 family protein n=1 Tax=Streptomyces sp. NPDC004658 TaxID=3154672 RepID=UPI00339F4168